MDKVRNLTVFNKVYSKNKLIKFINSFVREKARNEFGNSLGYVFIGEGELKDFYGSKPMSINWELNEPMPHYLWKDAAKLSIG